MGSERGPAAGRRRCAPEGRRPSVAPLVEYAEGVGRTAEIHLDEMVPGVPGALAIRHPDACQALVSAAAEAGATVARGAGHVEITSGLPGGNFVPLKWRGLQTVKAPLVIGADGRNSAVAAEPGVRLRRQHSIEVPAGLLVELEGVPDDFDIMATEGDFSFGILHQRFGRARVYLFSAYRASTASQDQVPGAFYRGLQIRLCPRGASRSPER